MRRMKGSGKNVMRMTTTKRKMKIIIKLIITAITLMKKVMRLLVKKMIDILTVHMNPMTWRSSYELLGTGAGKGCERRPVDVDLWTGIGLLIFGIEGKMCIIC